MLRTTRFRALPLLAVTALAVPLPAAGQAGEITDDVPGVVDTDARYLIYLHGRIIETQGRRPTSPAFGVYEYDRILESFARRGYHVISQVRPADTRIGAYADRVATQVGELIERGVPPERITVVGFSKGGMITILASSRLGLPDVRYVILAGCTSAILGREELALTGRVLSIHEATDGIGLSCAPLFSRSPDARETAERLIETGARHGAFYLPREAWLEPLFTWLEGAPSRPRPTR